MPKPTRLCLALDLDAPGRQIGDLQLRYSDVTSPLGYHPIPVISLRGGPGPRVLILGGTHGDEFEGPAAILRLAQSLSVDTLRGQIVLIPALNAPAVQASSRTSPLDAGNLNRAFPGDADGGPTAMIADYLEHHMIPGCAAVIDLHSGGKASFFAPCTLPTQVQDDGLREANMALARAFGLPLIWELGPHNDDRTVNGAAARAGVPMIAAELGGGGGVDPAITDSTEEGLLRCLATLGLIDHPVPKRVARHVTVAAPEHSHYAPADGLFDRAISAGDTLCAGDVAGHLHFPMEPERPSREIRAPVDGFVLAHTCRGLVRRGDLLALIVQDVPPSDP